MIQEQNIITWVDEVERGPQREFREAVHTILSGIANDSDLKAKMIIKGGILLAIRYQTHRYTKDIDFSTDLLLDDIDKDEIVRKLNHSMAIISEQLDYDLDCRVQSCKIQPSNKPDAKFPSIKMKIGYAYRYDKGKYKRLMAGASPTTIDIDFSLNEFILNMEVYDIGNNERINAYSLTDLIAEKLRSVLQQTIRGRHRRQDIYDIFVLIEKFHDLDHVEKTKILESLIAKANSRDIFPTQNSFKDEDIRKRSESDYHTLKDEIVGELPDFDKIYNLVRRFYESLPWGN